MADTARFIEVTAKLPANETIYLFSDDELVEELETRLRLMDRGSGAAILAKFERAVHGDRP